MYKIIAESFPNNEIRLKWGQYLPRRKDAPPSRLKQKQTLVPPPKTESLRVSSPEHIPVAPARSASAPPLTLSSNSGTPGRAKPGFGTLGRSTAFGTKARRQILRSGGALGKISACPNQTLFFTLTLPGSTHAAKLAIAEWSSYLVQQLQQWIGNHVPRKLSIYCWELQKRGALHLHYCCYVPDEGRRTFFAESIKNWWHSTLGILSDRVGIDFFGRESGGTWRDNPEILQAEAVECRKAPQAYLSKYVGKRRGKSEDSRYPLYRPVRWYGVSRPLLAELKSRTKKIEKEYHSRREASRYVEFCKEILEPFAIKGYVYKAGYLDWETRVYYVPEEIQEALWTAMNNSSNLWRNYLENLLLAQSKSLLSLSIRLQQVLPDPMRIGDDLTPKERRSIRRLQEGQATTYLELRGVRLGLSVSCIAHEKSTPAYFHEFLDCLFDDWSNPQKLREATLKFEAIHSGFMSTKSLPHPTSSPDQIELLG